MFDCGTNEKRLSQCEAKQDHSRNDRQQKAGKHASDGTLHQVVLAVVAHKICESQWKLSTDIIITLTCCSKGKQLFHRPRVKQIFRHGQQSVELQNPAEALCKQRIDPHEEQSIEQTTATLGIDLIEALDEALTLLDRLEAQ